MCGLVGIVSFNRNQFYHTQQKAFKNLLYLDAFRGEDGTGVFGITPGGNVDMIKSEKPSGEFVYTPEFKEFTANMISGYDMVVGHNRKATVGTINDEAAHPFIHNDTILVHNGRFEQHKKYHDTEVDSEALCRYLDENQDNLVEALKNIDGAFSLVWYHTKSKKLHFWRNDQRPMIHAISGPMLYFASERGIVLEAIARAGDTIPREKDVYATTERELLTLDFSKKSRLAWEQVMVPKKEYPKSTSSTYHGLWCGNDDDDDTLREYYGRNLAASPAQTTESSTKTTTPPAKTTSTTQETTKSNVVLLTNNKKTGGLERNKFLTEQIGGKAPLFRLVDFVVDDTSMSSNTVEGIWTERISVIVEDVPAETIQAFHDNPHKTKFFYGVIKNVKSNISEDTHELWLDAKTVIPYDGFMSSNNCLISGDMIEDLGGEDCVYCEDADCPSGVNPIPKVDWEDTFFRFKYKNGVLSDSKIICKACLARYKKTKATKKQTRVAAN